MSTSKKSTVAAIGVVSGAISVGLTIFLANTANSLALWADSAATFLDFAAIFIAWQGFRKVETNSTETFNYGFGKFESFFSMVMAALMFISFFCIMTVAWNRFGHPVAVEGLGVVLGIGMHIIFGVINGFLLFQSLHLEKQEKTPLSSAQRKIFT
nr:cation transporter [Candidatus Cloacimonadota bacterium]